MRKYYVYLPYRGRRAKRFFVTATVASNIFQETDGDCLEITETDLGDFVSAKPVQSEVIHMDIVAEPETKNG